MVDIATLGLRVDSTEVAQGAQQLDKLTTAGGRAEASTDRLAKAAREAATSEQMLGKALGMTAAEASAAARATATLESAHARAAGISKQTGAAMINLGRQFTDVGMMAALGQAPLLILIQQGPQIADAFAEAARGGMGFGAVLRTMAVQMGLLKVVQTEATAATLAAAAADEVATVAAAELAVANEAVAATATTAAAAEAVMLAPLALILIAATAIATVLGSGFLLATRNANKASGDLTEGLGLTEKQLEKVKQKTITVGDTFMATFTVLGRHIKQGPIGDALDFIADKWRKLLAGIAEAAINSAAGVAAVFMAAGDAMKGGDFMKSLGSHFSSNKAAIGAFGEEVTAEAAARRRKQIIKDAGGHAASTPRDQTDERAAQIEQALAQAKEGELQAQLALTKDLQVRSGIEKQIAAQALAVKQAEITRQIANIADDKGLSAAKKAELTRQLQIVQAIEGRTAAAKDALIDQQLGEALDNQSIEQRREIAGYFDRITAAKLQGATTAVEINRLEAEALKQRQQDEKVEQQTRLAHSDMGEAAKAQAVTAMLEAQAQEQIARERLAQDRVQKEARQLAEAGLQLQIDVLASQGSIALTAGKRRDIALAILALEQTDERLKLEAVTASATATKAEQAIAAARLAVLGQIQQNETEAAMKRAFDLALQDGTASLSDLASAIDSHDFGRLLQTFAATLNSLNGPAGLSAMLGQLGQVYSAGSNLGGSLAHMIGGSETIGSKVGGIFGAIPGAIASLFGSSNKEKQAKAQAAEAERQRLQAAADQRSQLEITQLQLLGHATEALAKSRALELSKMDASNQALAQEVYALQDAARLRSLDIRLMEASHNSVEALAATRAEEMRGASDAEQAILSLIYAQEDLTKASEDAAAVVAKATEIAKTRNDLEFRLMELNGEGLNVVALKRKLELDQLDPSLQALQALVWAREDEADIIAKQAEALKASQAAYVDHAKSVASLSADLADATGNAAGATALRRQIALMDITDPELRALQQKVWKAEDAKAFGQTIQTAIDKFDQFAKALRSFAGELTVGALSGLGLRQQAAQARSAFASIASLGVGDEARMNGLPGAGRSFLETSKATSRTLLDYLRDVSKVQNAVGGSAAFAESQKSVAQKQLDQLQAINDNTALLAGVATGKSVPGMVATKPANAYGVGPAGGANADLGFAGGQRVNLGIGSGGPISLYPGWEKDFPGLAGTTALSDDDLIQLAISQARAQLRAGLAGSGIDIQDRMSSLIPGYANGVSGVFSGRPGVDANLFQARVTAGERVSIRPANSNDDTAEELRALREEVRAGLALIAKHTKDSADVLNDAARNRTSLATRAA